MALLQAISDLTVGSPRITVRHLLILCQLHINLVLELDFISKDLVYNFLILGHELAICGGRLDFIINDYSLQPWTGDLESYLVLGGLDPLTKPIQNGLGVGWLLECNLLLASPLLSHIVTKLGSVMIRPKTPDL